MKKAILAKKLGMTRVFAEDGTAVPVTVLQAGPCYVTQVKTMETDGYEAVQISFSEKREKLTPKPMQGHFQKAGVKNMRYVREFPLGDDTPEVGAEVQVGVFEAGDLVDVSATSKGKGFAGVIKRYNQGRGRMTHGSHFHRAPGSMGGASSPSKVFKSKKLPGHKGSENVTIQNLTVVNVDEEKNVILVKGAVPGAKGCVVSIREAVKA